MQHTIAATEKYNFPQTPMETTLPKRFMELSLRSLRQLENTGFQLNQQAFQQLNASDALHPQQLQLKLVPMVLKPRTAETTVAAVDTSSMKIGETNIGVLVAVRGASVCRSKHAYKYTRLGPFIFHVSDENKNDVCNRLQDACFNEPTDHHFQSSPSLMQMPTRLAGLLERWLQAMLSKSVDSGLILFDGSLTSGTPDSPIWLVKEILTNARERSNVVLAFSKMTTLRFNGHLITDILPDHRPPYLLETIGLRSKPPLVLFGDVYVAKLTRGNCAFRLDIDREIPFAERLAAVERLLGNDLISQSYPECLRLAHILCTFTANEVIAMQHFVTRKCGLQIVNRPDMHRLLFGPFGKGESYS